MLDTGEWIALVVGLVAIISAVIAPYITARVNRAGSFERQSMELFFHEKTAAYSDLLQITSSFPQYPTDEVRYRLLYAVSRAQLFSSEKTGSKLAQFAFILNDPITPNVLNEYALAYEAAFSAMREELLGFYQPRPLKK